ncbi:Glycosyltransferase 28 domain protein [Halothece sp. PCC 7418]|uniref:glycosyltransferase family protein n=1 Tax=Halothece sp. (strain PCC 7418) TaxID=65093 RepID=UPI0002A06F0A|nr:glycosyltransferase [Halothece sp. PCC 7418]AFZ44693.1 Glycosyltransferase 28 domain protein [Halothece sp. PCC 7418]
MKLMVYSHDAFGLGNIRRMLAICEHLLQAIPNLSILVVSGSPALHQLRLPKGLDYIKLPCLGRNQEGKLTVTFLNGQFEDTLNLRKHLICTAAAHFQPDLLLVDKKPNGLQGELQATLDYLKYHHPKTRYVLLLRDILDSPKATIAQWQRENYYSLTESLYDEVWIVGSPEIFNASKQYRFSTTLQAKTHFMGYIQRPQGLQPPEAIRQALGITERDSFILVTPGGGKDGFRLLDAYLHAQATDMGDQNFISLIVGGSEMPLAHKQQFIERIRPVPHWHWLEFTNDLASYMSAADLVISMGGYNTVSEILSLQKRAVVVPRIEPVAEQWIRAQRLAELGLLSVLHPQQLTPLRLAQAMAKELSASHGLTAQYSLDFKALPRITEALLRLLNQDYHFDPRLHSVAV